MFKLANKLLDLAVKVRGNCPHWVTSKKYEMTGDGFEIKGTRCIICEELIDWEMID